MKDRSVDFFRGLMLGLLIGLLMVTIVALLWASTQKHFWQEAIERSYARQNAGKWEWIEND